MFKKYKNIIYSKPVILFIYYFINIYCMTFRMHIKNDAKWKALIDNGNSILLCGWHQQFFSVIRIFGKYQKYTPALMISQSKDGDLIAGVAKKSGWYAARGSSSKGGISAMNLIIEHLNRFKLAGHIVDGPTGPMGKVKSGLINIAQKSNAIVVPFYVIAKNAWHFNSWDRFMLPKPFSKVTLSFGKEIHLEVTNDSNLFEKQRKNLETIMLPYLVNDIK